MMTQTYKSLSARLRMTRQKADAQTEIMRQAALVKELEGKASEERMRLHLMLVVQGRAV